MNIFQRWKKVAIHNKALVVTGIIVAVCTSLYTGAAISQYYLMKQVATDQITLMRNTAIDTNTQVTNIISEAKNISNAAKESLEQSKRALDASIDIARKDQRAWVGQIEILPAWRDEANNPLYIKEGSKLWADVIILNSGKSPALNVKSRMRIMAFPANHDFVPDYRDLRGNSIGVLQPQMKLIAKSLPSYRSVNDSDITSLKNRTMILYLYGEIQYEDIFRTSHKTTYCYVLAPNLNSFVLHSEYNSAN